MTTIIDSEYLLQRAAAIKAAIVALETQRLAIMTGGVQSYQLDTGQTRTLVTRMNVGVLTDEINKLENQLRMLDAQLNGAATRVIPGF